MHSSSSSTVSSADMWNELRKALNDVFGRVPVPPRQYVAYYTNVYKSCTMQKSNDNAASSESPAKDIYEKLKYFVNSKSAIILLEGKSKSGEELLSWYCKEWANFHFCSKVVDGLFAYLNRNFLQKAIETQEKVNYFLVQTLVIQLWKENMFGILEGRIIEAVLDIIHRERCGEAVNRSLLKAVLNTYVDLCCSKENAEQNLAVYKEFFEDLFIESTKQFYEAEAAEFLSKNSIGDYMKKVEERLLEEEARASHYLHSSSRDILMKSVEEVLINSRIEVFDAKSLLEQMAKDDLKRMNSLCTRVGKNLQTMQRALEEQIVREGLEIMEKFQLTSKMEPKAYIEQLLEIHNRYSALIKEVFNNDIGFVAALDKAATVFINKNAVTVKNKNCYKTPAMLAKCCDGLLKKNNKMLDEAELEAKLDKMVIIFKYIDDKDIFDNFYTRFLSSRVIAETSASEEAELSFISKLKTLCGFQYTRTMSKMIDDVRISRDLSATFKEEVMKDSVIEELPDFTTKVLSTGSWPEMSSVSLCLPLKMARSVDLFSKFYTEKHSGRKITWAFGQSRGEVTSNCFSAKKVFVASCPQIAVLMIYNTATTCTFGEIVEASGMEKKFASRTVAALVKSEILKGKELSATEYSEDIKFDLNLHYRSTKVKVDLTKFVVRPAAGDVKKDDDKESRFIESDRKNSIEACIVRIMKMRKTINHQKLMIEVLEQLSTRFKPRVDFVKKCIGNLIEKEYMKRSDDAQDVYEYLA